MVAGFLILKQMYLMPTYICNAYTSIQLHQMMASSLLLTLGLLDIYVFLYVIELLMLIFDFLRSFTCFN